MLLAAAASWAISLVIVRAHRFTASPFVLAPWQMLVVGCLLLPLAIVAEGEPRPIGLGSDRGYQPSGISRQS